MATRERIAHSKRVGQVATRSPTAAAVELEAPTQTPAQLARAAVQAFRAELEFYRQHVGTRDEPSDPRLAPSEWDAELILKMLPEEFTFGQFHTLSRTDPEQALKRWEEVKVVAAEDLKTGWLAARLLDDGHSAWRRAVFAAIRAGLRRALQPRDEAEDRFVDEMAQYELLRQIWLKTATNLTDSPTMLPNLIHREAPISSDERRSRTGGKSAHVEALHMVERFQRLGQSALRALLSLRRGNGSIVVRGSGQVNVALGPQLNAQVPDVSVEIDGDERGR